MDSVSNDVDGKYYRLVDAVGGATTMYMELRFVQDSLYFNTYTSKLGQNSLPTRHMTFKASKQYPALSAAAATAVGFPQNTPAWDFSDGFNSLYLYRNPGDISPKSATFLAAEEGKGLFELAEDSGDPFTIADHPYVGYLQVDLVRNALIENTTCFIYLSQKPLMDDQGLLAADFEVYNTVLRFPEIIGSQDSFTFTYLHPGDYYVNVIADANGDGFLSEGDITAKSVFVTVAPEGQHQITVDDITIQN